MNVMKSQEPPFRSAPVAPVSQEPPPFGWLPFLLSFLRRRWTTIAISVAVTLGIGLASALISTPRFTAETSLLMDIRRADILRQQAGVQDPQTLNAVLESQLEVLRSEGLAREAVVRLGLTNSNAFAPAATGLIDRLRAWMPGPRAAAPAAGGADARIDRAALRLMQMTSVRRVGQTYVMTLSVTSTSAVEAARLANGLAETYIAEQLDAKEDTIHQTAGWLQSRIGELRDQALDADRAVQGFKASHNIVDTGHGLLDGQQLSELSSQLVAARAHTADAQARLQRITAILDGAPASGGVTEGLDNKVIVGLRQQYVDDDRRATDLAAKYGQDHVVVRNLRAEMVELQQSIHGELARIAQTYKSDYDVAVANETAVRQQLDKVVARSAQTNADMVDLRSLQSSADTYRAMYESFLERYTQAVQDQSFPVSDTRVITVADPPSRKSEPKTTVILALAGVAGAAIGFTIALFREILDRGIHTPERLRGLTGLRAIGVLPLLRRRDRKRPGGAVFASDGPAGPRALTLAPGNILRHVVDHPRSAFAAAFRSMRMRMVSQRMRAHDIKVVGCISNRQGAGTSTVAANLALYLAQTGARTVLLDWDFQNATLSRTMTPRADAGCLEVMDGTCDLRDAVWHDPQTGLDVLPSGHRVFSGPGADLVTAEGVHDLLSELKGRYGYVVIDLPSLEAIADVHVATHLLDAMVLVVDSRRPDHDALEENLSRIGLDDTCILGAVLNRTARKRAGVAAPGPLPERIPAEVG
jgi:succinoglycan biosynthesis transport protein ExoP